MLKVGVTGGIGSGKTTATNLFQDLGVEVVDADLIAREVVEPGQPALQRIEARYGAGILQSDGRLDRRTLRDAIFSKPDEKRWLEGLLHPEILRLCRQRLDAATGDYVILSSPLLIESGEHQLVDRILVVDIPEDLQLDRTTNRDQAQPEQIQQIIDNQMSRSERLRHATDVLDNSGSLQSLREGIEQLHDHYRKLARTSRMS